MFNPTRWNRPHESLTSIQLDLDATKSERKICDVLVKDIAILGLDPIRPNRMHKPQFSNLARYVMISVKKKIRDKYELAVLRSELSLYPLTQESCRTYTLMPYYGPFGKKKPEILRRQFLGIFFPFGIIFCFL